MKSTLLHRLILILFFISLSCEDNTIEESANVLKIDELINQSREKSLPNEEKIEILQQAEKIINSINKTNIRANQLIDLSVEYFAINDLEKFKELNIKTIKLLHKDSYQIAKGSALHNIGMYYRKKNQSDSAMYYFYKAKSFYRKLNPKKIRANEKYYYQQGKLLLDIAILKRKANDYYGSNDLIIKAIESFNESKNLRFIPMCYASLGISAKYLNRYDESINYYLKSIESAYETDKEEMYMFIGSNNIGTVYKSLKNYKIAIAYYEKALSLKSYIDKNPSSLARVLDNIGYVKFLADKDNEEALKLMNQAYIIRDSINDFVGLSTNNLHYAEYYKAHNEFKKSKYHASKVVELAPKVKSNEELLQAYQLLSEVSEPKPVWNMHRNILPLTIA